MTIEEIKIQVAKAIAENKQLVIKGYTSSEGAVSDYTVRVIGSSGYRELVSQALDKALTKNAADAFVAPCDANATIWLQALNEQRASWQKTLDGEHSASQWGEAYQQHSDGYFTKEGEDVVYIKHMRIIESLRIVDVENTTKSSPKTIYKRLMVSQTPLRDYMAVLKLTPDKVAEVYAV